MAGATRAGQAGRAPAPWPGRGRGSCRPGGAGSASWCSRSERAAHLSWSRGGPRLCSRTWRRGAGSGGSRGRSAWSRPASWPGRSRARRSRCTSSTTCCGSPCARVEGAVAEVGTFPEPFASAGAGPRLPLPTWTDFRGPGRLGVYTETPIRTDWPAEGLPLVWRRPAGAAYGSLAVAEGLVFSLEQRRERETLVAYDFDTGAEVRAAAWDARFEEPLSGEGPRSTPVWADGVVYALGAAGELGAYAARTGERLWRADLLELAPAANLLYGLTASPLVHGERLIVA